MVEDATVTPICLASTVLYRPYAPGRYARTYPVYPHQKADPLPAISLVSTLRDWHCDTCGREGRLLRQYSGGLVACADAACESRFVVPVSELREGE
jgi:hypothetical protein